MSLNIMIYQFCLLNIGACGDGRCLDSDEGLECLCGLGKAGDRCERDVSITEPSFSKNSYLAYPTPKRLDK